MELRSVKDNFELNVAEDTEVCEFQTTRVEWKIKNYSNQLRKYNTGFFDSPYFYFCHTRWHIRLYPWLQMARILKEESSSRHDIYLKLAIKINNGSDSPCVESRIKFTLMKGFSKQFFFYCKPFGDFVDKDGTLTVLCSLRNMEDKSLTTEVSSRKLFPAISTVESASQTTSFDGTLTLSEDLKNMYISRSHADVAILVKNEKFSAHRNILAARSGVSASMFTHEMAEKNSGTVEIPDCSPDSFELFLLFLYTGKVDGIEFSNAVHLYKIADKYDVKELKEECVRCLVRDVSVDLFCDVIHLAAIYNDSDLLKAATDFFLANTEAILLTIKWLDLLKEHPLLCNELYLKGIKNNK